MSDVPDERIIAFVDGGLDGAVRAAFERSLAQDPALAARVAAHRWMARQIVAAYGAPPDAAIDAELIARLGLGSDAPGDKIVALDDYRRAAARRKRTWSLRIGAIAASLAAGVMIGQVMMLPRGALITERDGRLVAGGVLAEGLSNRLAGQPGPVRIGITFRTATGICRTFQSGEASGLGCREAGHWRVPIMVAGGQDDKPASDYRLAGGGEAPSVMAEVDRRIQGEPLAPSEEARLKANGWR